MVVIVVIEVVAVVMMWWKSWLWKSWSYQWTSGGSWGSPSVQGCCCACICSKSFTTPYSTLWQYQLWWYALSHLPKSGTSVIIMFDTACTFNMPIILCGNNAAPPTLRIRITETTDVVVSNINISCVSYITGSFSVGHKYYFTKIHSQMNTWRRLFGHWTRQVIWKE